MAGLSSLGVPGVHGKWQPPPFQILSDLLTPFQPRGADYAHQIILAPRIFRPYVGPVYMIEQKFGLKFVLCED
jgi:hypothetical protein